jgi:hypothetical protein
MSRVGSSSLSARPMRLPLFVAAAALCLLNEGPVSASANNLRELYLALDRCLSEIPIRGAAGSELTVVFSLRRDGSLLGRPRISYSKLTGDATAQQEFARQIAAGFDKCLPLSISDALGGAIAGRPLAMRFVVGRRQTNI